MNGHLSPHTLAGFDTLDRGERQSALRHASVCTECRERLLAGDPTRSFALLGLDAMPADRLEALSASVARRISEPRPVRRPRTGWAAVAAAVVLGAMLGTYLVWRDLSVPRDEVAASPRLEEAPSGIGRVELLESPGQAELLDLQLGDTQVVMIFDRELDI